MTTAKEDRTEQDPTKDSKQAATPPPADGAVHVDASSRKVQHEASENIERLQLTPAVEPSMNTSRSYARKYTTKQAATSPPAGENTKRLQLAPAVYLPPTSGNEKANEELEEVGNYKETAIPNKMVKKIGTSTQTRQEKRRIRIAEHRSREDTNLAPSPPTIEGEEDDQDEYDEDDTPGAVRVPGINATGVAEPNIVAHIVDEVPQAEIVDGTNTRRRALLCTGIVVIMLAIILGTVFGTRDNSPKTVSVPETTAPTISSVPSKNPSETPTQTPTVAPLNNSLCEEPLPIMLGGSATAVSLQEAALQSVVFCDDENKQAQHQPGLWYTYTGQGTPVIARASPGADLHVYLDCNRNNSCEVRDGGSMSNTVEWTAESGVDYLVLITLSNFSASTTIERDNFELQIISNQFCEGAQPIVPGDADVVATVENATKQDVVFCEDVAQTTSSEPGVWYKYLNVDRNQRVFAQTSGGVDLHVYPACNQIACNIPDASYKRSTSSSTVEWTAVSGAEYRLLVTSTVFSSGLPGDFALSIIATRLATLSQLFVDNEISVQALQDPSTPQYSALDWMANIDNTDLQNTLSDDALVERFVLVLLYYTTGGANWSDQSLFLSPSLDICSWTNGSREGVFECNGEGSVTSLDLFENRLIGSLPTEIGLLSRLQGLYLIANALTGTLPTQLVLLSSLEELWLSHNKLSGAVPSELGQISTLQVLTLSSNALTGTVPTQLGLLSSLAFLSLDDNKLSRAVPSELGQIATLQRLVLSSNALTGTLPTQLGLLSSIEVIYLRDNKLSGAVPSELGQIAALQDLVLSSNDLTGTLPTQLGTLSSLERLGLSNNKLSGAVPSELGQIATLQNLILFSSGLSGTIPPQIDQNQVDVLFF